MTTNPYQPPLTEPDGGRSRASSEPAFWNPIGWMLLIPPLGLAIGVVSRLSRPYLDYGVHLDALLSVLLLAIIGLALLVRCIRANFIIANGFYQSGVISLWTTFVLGWSVIHGSVFGPLLEACALWWLGCAVLGIIVFAVAHSARRARRPE